MNKLKDWVSRLKKGHMLSVIGVFIIIIAVLITVLVRKEQDSKQASENSYNMAFYSLVDYVENVETYLAKSLISSTPEHGANINKCMERSKFSSKLFSKIANRKSRIRKHRKIFKPS